ncbi:hypothetical protein RSOLAG22IIIB_03735 [Rhizoctonia solani]|uniref:Uncharacterized protein n=1 Tax=Rhizoctonia solani TaxID=456999 RepID=A0A0K6FSU4_9AGAM|nr:hypothetical protein RSOLAG22IIIB_03735 [Rhizoctonia solani]
MPNLTVRNAVRHALTRASHGPISIDKTHGSIPTSGIRGSVSTDKIQAAIKHVHTLAGGTGDPDLNLMRIYVGTMSARVRQVDQLVTDYIRNHTRPCPSSTLLLVPSQQPIEKDTTHALVHRILRYVSPHPWGTPESEAHRRSTSIERIVQNVLREHEQTQAQDRLSSFCAGAHVLWSPIWVRPDGAIRIRRAGEQSGRRVRGWLASRQPPTSSLEQKAHPGETMVWDNRFLVRVPNCPDLVVRPRGRFVLPQVVRNQQVVDECGVEFIRELDAI